MGVFHVTLYISSSLFYFIVLLLIMRSQPAYFLNYITCFKSRKASYVRLLVRTMQIGSISDGHWAGFQYDFFPTKKLCLWNENVNTFHRYLLKALLCILFKLDQVSFHVVVWSVWLMLHNFVRPCMFYNIYASALWSPPVNRAGNIFLNSRMKY